MNNSEFDFGQSQGQKLAFAFRRAGEGNALLEWLSTGDNLQQVGRLQRSEAELVLKEKPVPAPEPIIDSIILVDRSIRPSYPDWMKEVMHPELESVGPAEYDISAIEQWLHYGQKDGKYIEGNKIYNHLKKTDTLKTCLGLRDLEEIQKKGIAFFRKHFKGKVVFGWAGIVRYRNGDLCVPCLCEHDGRVLLNWRWSDDAWHDDNPALRLASSTMA